MQCWVRDWALTGSKFRLSLHFHHVFPAEVCFRLEPSSLSSALPILASECAQAEA